MKNIYSKKYNAAKERSQNVLGRQLAKARKDAGLSLIAFSELLGEYGINISGGSINKWELGETLPNAYQLMAVCHALGIDNMKDYFNADFRPIMNETGLNKLNDYKDDLIASGRYKV